MASGILHEADADRETVINASGAGDDVAAAWKRGVILNRIAGYGLQFQRGEYENLDELRANILAGRRRNWKPCGAMRPTPWASTGQ